MTKKQNSKPYDLKENAFRSSVFGEIKMTINSWLFALFAIWILLFGIYLRFVICRLLFPFYPGSDCRMRAVMAQ
jgi:hypothetical protein